MDEILIKNSASIQWPVIRGNTCASVNSRQFFCAGPAALLEFKMLRLVECALFDFMISSRGIQLRHFVAFCWWGCTTNVVLVDQRALTGSNGLLLLISTGFVTLRVLKYIVWSRKPRHPHSSIIIRSVHKLEASLLIVEHCDVSLYGRAATQCISSRRSFTCNDSSWHKRWWSLTTLFTHLHCRSTTQMFYFYSITFYPVATRVRAVGDAVVETTVLPIQ